MTRAIRVCCAALLVLGAGATATAARADISNSTGTNVQDGNNRASGNQNGTDKSGDAVGGQVVGVVSSGRTSVDARNTSVNSDVTSGDARGSNDASTFTGLTAGATTTVTAADLTNIFFANNLQDGSNRSTYSQSANVTTGDGVAGQVIGAVTAAGGSTSIVAANRSDNVSVQTGDARSDNDLALLTGLNETSDNATTIAADILNSCNGVPGVPFAAPACDNVQEGSNRANVRQASTASTGDGVAGQVIGAVSAGATSIDANNASTNTDVTTGDARTSNDSAMLVGLNDSGATTIGAADITNVGSIENLQEGNNNANVNQTARATTGDGVGGEVIGSVTSAGGSASIVAANTTTNSDVQTGDARSDNTQNAMVGFDVDADRTLTIADITNACSLANTQFECDYIQEGSNRLTLAQTAASDTGDGVAGQVLGVVSAGAASVDAANRTDDSSATTGDASSANVSSAFVGLNDGGTTTVGTVAADITNANAENIQEGSNRKTLTQSADATTGDAVAGQVSGVVTSAGGSASVVVANTSTSIDSTTGDSDFGNTDASFVGVNISRGPLTIG